MMLTQVLKFFLYSSQIPLIIKSLNYELLHAIKPLKPQNLEDLIPI